MSEQPAARIEAAITRSGFNYEAAIGAALTARSLAGGPGLVPPDPEWVAERMSGGRAEGPRLAGTGLLARLLPQAEPEAEIG